MESHVQWSSPLLAKFCRGILATHLCSWRKKTLEKSAQAMKNITYAYATLVHLLLLPLDVPDILEYIFQLLNRL